MKAKSEITIINVNPCGATLYLGVPDNLFSRTL